MKCHCTSVDPVNHVHKKLTSQLQLTLDYKLGPSADAVRVLGVKGPDNRSFNDGLDFENFSKLSGETYTQKTANCVSN